MKKLLLYKIGLSSRHAVASLILVVNSFVWYMYAYYILSNITALLKLDITDTLILWAINLNAVAISALASASFIIKHVYRIKFLCVWMLSGVFVSFAPIFLIVTNKLVGFLISFLFGIAFGLGMPSSMAYYADNSATETRARIGGIIYFLIGLGGIFLVSITLVKNVFLWSVILVIFRVVGLVMFIIVAPREDNVSSKRIPSYISIIRQRSFFLYFIPWVMFCLINYAAAPILSKYLSSGFINLLVSIEGGLIGIFALIAGFLSDAMGRKRIAILGFVIIGLGYAVLGVYPEGLINILFYTVVDGIAWGIFNTLFVMTLWGDIAYDKACEKYYALGGLPYLFSEFLRVLLGSYIAEVIPRYAIFTFASFFLFLAVIPLMFAPETLPEKKIRERELKLYIEKAKKIREKFT